MTTYEEWRVTGDPGPGFPPYTFVWTTQPDARGRVTRDAEAEARDFARLMRDHDSWTSGPHLHRRTVTVTEWRDAGPPPVNRPHPTCRDVTGTDQTPRSEWICGPECPDTEESR